MRRRGCDDELEIAEQTGVDVVYNGTITLGPSPLGARSRSGARRVRTPGKFWHRPDLPDLPRRLRGVPRRPVRDIGGVANAARRRSPVRATPWETWENPASTYWTAPAPHATCPRPSHTKRTNHTMPKDEKRVKPVCPECGGENVAWITIEGWYWVDGKWDSAGAFTSNYGEFCNDCDCSIEPKWVPISDALQGELPL